MDPQEKDIHGFELISSRIGVLATDRQNLANITPLVVVWGVPMSQSSYQGQEHSHQSNLSTFQMSKRPQHYSQNGSFKEKQTGPTEISRTLTTFTSDFSRFKICKVQCRGQNKLITPGSFGRTGAKSTQPHGAHGDLAQARVGSI